MKQTELHLPLVLILYVYATLKQGMYYTSLCKFFDCLLFMYCTYVALFMLHEF